MDGIYFHKCQDSFPNIYCYVPWHSQFVLVGCLAFMKINTRTLFPTSTAMSIDSRSLFSMDAWRLWKSTPGVFSQHLLLCPLTVAVGSQWMPFIYFHKRQDAFPNIYCYVIWQSQFLLDGCLVFMKINARTLFPTSTAMSPDSRSLFSMDASHLWKWMPGLFFQLLLLCPLTVAVCSRWMPGIYFRKRQDSFLTVYCYLPWQFLFVLDGCLAFMKINTRTLFPTSTAMFPDSCSWFSMDHRRLWK